MQKANALLDIYQKRGAKGLPLKRIYRHLYDPELFLRAYGKIYRNDGAMTKGTTTETVDGMDLQRIHNIIGFLRMERYEWTPVRRTEIPKANGKTRPLGIPTWSDKLVQETLRTLLEPYYEQRFSDHSHGFRPNRGCHSALRDIRKHWQGTVWFIEGDIKGCFDNIDHTVLLEIIRRDIHDGRLVKLIDDLLKVGYMKDWKWQATISGTPQGGIISPLLANIYLNELDRFVEETLIPANTSGDRRRDNPDYARLSKQRAAARRQGNRDAAVRILQEMRRLPASDTYDPDFRRLRYVRYADDFLLGFAGPKIEAEGIRNQIAEFLSRQLKLTLSKEKTLISHAVDDKARFLGYEITVSRADTRITANRRSVNGIISLLMPRKTAQKVFEQYSKKGKIIHQDELINEQVYTILRRYQSVMVGIYNYYCMATNVGRHTRMGLIKWILETALTKTLASKLQCTVTEVYRRYRMVVNGLKALQVVIERPDKEPLVATFGGVSFKRISEGMGIIDFHPEQAWFSPSGNRSEVVQRLLADECELCGKKAKLEAHHIRKLADIDRPGHRPKETWEKIMNARKRKTLMICKECHDDIHAGRYDGPRL